MLVSVAIIVIVMIAPQLLCARLGSWRTPSPPCSDPSHAGLPLLTCMHPITHTQATPCYQHIPDPHPPPPQIPLHQITRATLAGTLQTPVKFSNYLQQASTHARYAPTQACIHARMHVCMHKQTHTPFKMCSRSLHRWSQGSMD